MSMLLFVNKKLLPFSDGKAALNSVLIIAYFIQP